MHSSLRRLTRGLTGWAVDVAPSGRREPREPGAPFGRRILEMPRRRWQRARGVAKASQLGGDARQGRGLGGWGSADGEKPQVSVWRHCRPRLRSKSAVYDLKLRPRQDTATLRYRYLRFFWLPRCASMRRFRLHQEFRQPQHFRSHSGSRREGASMPSTLPFSLSTLANPA